MFFFIVFFKNATLSILKLFCFYWSISTVFLIICFSSSWINAKKNSDVCPHLLHMCVIFSLWATWVSIFCLISGFATVWSYTHCIYVMLAQLQLFFQWLYLFCSCFCIFYVFYGFVFVIWFLVEIFAFYKSFNVITFKYTALCLICYVSYYKWFLEKKHISW